MARLGGQRQRNVAAVVRALEVDADRRRARRGGARDARRIGLGRPAGAAADGPEHPAAVGAERRPRERRDDVADDGLAARDLVVERAAREPEARGVARREVDTQRVAGGRSRSRAEEDAVRHDDAGQRRVGLGREGAELGPPRLDEARADRQRRGAPRDDRRAADGRKVDLGVDDAHRAPLEYDEPLLPSSPLSPSELPSDSLEDTPNVDTVHASDDEEV